LLSIKRKFSSHLSILVVGSILLRLVVYLTLPVSDDFGRYSNSGSLYFSALTEHFGDYLLFTTNIPPATFIIHAFVLTVADAKTAMNVQAFLILVFVLNITAVALLYNSAKRIGASQKLTFFVMLIFSVALIPFELWRAGMHYDHLTLFFTSFFLWALVRLITDESSYSNMFLVSLSGALLVSQSAASSAIVPFSILVILCFLYLSKKQFLKLGYAVLITLLLPVTVFILISNKNRTAAQEGLTSNKAGPAMMMVVQRAYRYDAVKLREMMKENNAPAWYLWTYDHARPPVDSVTGKEAEGWINLSQAFGICFFSADGKAKKNTWQFDFDPLIQYLRANGYQKEAKIAEDDAGDALQKPYRFAGFSPELSPRWIGVYGEVSKKMFFIALSKNPIGMGKAFAEQQGIFALYGPLFLYGTTQDKASLFARAGLRTLKTQLPLYQLLVPVTLVFALFSFIVYWIVLINIPVTVFQFLKNGKRGRRHQPVSYFLLLSIPVLCIAVVYSCLVGGENDRYFMQATPYLVVLATCLPSWIGYKSKLNS
jgi:hypothetical protein